MGRGRGGGKITGPAGLSSSPGDKINQPGYIVSRGEDIQGEDKDIPGHVAPGGNLSLVGLPPGATCPRGKIN